MELGFEMALMSGVMRATAAVGHDVIIFDMSLGKWGTNPFLCSPAVK